MDATQTDPFPEDRCLACFAELSSWTSVEDCLTAARILEDRALEGDQPNDTLVLPLVDDDLYESTFFFLAHLFMQTYATPESKVLAARLVDAEISDATAHTILTAQYKPNGKVARAELVPMLFPQLTPDFGRALLLESEPFVNELVLRPLRCLQGLTTDFFKPARELAELRANRPEGSGTPHIFHQPHADGPLPALIEAYVYHCCGLGIGFSPTETGVNRGFRSFEVVATPPVAERLFEAGTELLDAMFSELGEA